MNIHVVRRRGTNIGNEAINLALRLLLRETLAPPLNVVDQAAGGRPALDSRTVFELNQLADAVVVGGGNLFETNDLLVDAQALEALRPPLLLFALSHGRVYDAGGRLVPRTDSMRPDLIASLGRKAIRTLARDDATLAHLQQLGVANAELGGCPTFLLPSLLPGLPTAPDTPSTLLAVRNPEQISIAPAARGRLAQDVRRLAEALEGEGLGPVTVLCNDLRDLPFAASLGDLPYLLPDDVESFLGLLRGASLLVSFRLHAFVPAAAFGVHAVNISYDERSQSLVSTLGLGEWDVDYVHSEDVVADVLDRVRGPRDLQALVAEAQGRWSRLEETMRDALAELADAAQRYSATNEWAVKDSNLRPWD